jgi:hypothetical protein
MYNRPARTIINNHRGYEGTAEAKFPGSVAESNPRPLSEIPFKAFGAPPSDGSLATPLFCTTSPNAQLFTKTTPSSNRKNAYREITFHRGARVSMGRAL